MREADALVGALVRAAASSRNSHFVGTLPWRAALGRAEPAPNDSRRCERPSGIRWTRAAPTPADFGGDGAVRVEAEAEAGDASYRRSQLFVDQQSRCELFDTRLELCHVAALRRLAVLVARRVDEQHEHIQPRDAGELRELSPPEVAAHALVLIRGREVSGVCECLDEREERVHVAGQLELADDGISIA